MNSDDIPLTDAFYQNPHEYMQSYVRTLNNEIFLSEYHINNLYALLLIGRNSPWDEIKQDKKIFRGNSERMKEQIDIIVNNKVHDVKTILETLSNVYEDKAKKTAINQIEKLMSILKCKKKSIFIEKDKNSINYRNFQLLNQIAKMESKVKDKAETKEEELQKPQQQVQHKEENGGKETTVQEQTEKQEYKQESSNQTQEHLERCPEHHHQSGQNAYQEHSKLEQQEQKKEGKPNNEVFTIFYGLANFSSLSAMALSNCSLYLANMIEHNSSERFIKFKMSQNYNMTIKNQDPLFFDRTSQLSKIPSDLFVHHLFPYLTASELFGVRAVCKEWLQGVKQSWHSTFKREMFVQLLACEFCKDIQFYYKTIQLRNPFFQKLSLLIHALIEIIQWDSVYNSIQTNTLNLQLKRILIIILRLTGQPIELTNLNAINEAFFDQHKHKLFNLKERVAQFFSALSGADLTINDLRTIKTKFLDDPFMRVEEMNSQDKSPLLLTLFAKQMTLQQILRNHIFLCQEYLLNTKKRLDNVSRKIVYQKGYLEGVYKILLLKSSNEPFVEDKEPAEIPNFHEMLQSIFSNRNSGKPDFVIKTRSNSTQIFLDSATKLDLILTTVYSLEENKGKCTHHHSEEEKLGHRELKEEGGSQSENVDETKKERHHIINSVDLKIQCKPSSQNNKQQSEPSSDPK